MGEILNVDLSGIRNLYEWVENFNDQFDHFNKSFLQEAGNRALRLTKKHTPIGDYHKDVAFWAHKSKDSTELKLVELWGAGEGMKGGTLKRSWDTTEPVKRGNDYEISIYSDVEYAPYVEYGHRKVAFNTGKPGRVVGWTPGKFMAWNAIHSTSAKIPAAYNARLRAFLRSLGGAND